MLLIVLEGVDSTGKSSLAKFLARKEEAAYFHASGHRDMYDAMYAHHDNMLNNIEVCIENGLSVVVDRHWPSEFAYGRVLRPTNLAKYNFKMMQERIDKLDPIYIRCAPDENSWFRYQEVHKDHDREVFRHLTQSEYFAINGEYQALFDNIPHITYSIAENGHNLEEFWKLLP
jgi:thymidylate kinase